MTTPKRLIEVDLPIKRISAHARREKSIRHGHISTLHIWWARRPLAACRAVICAALWPDPADPLCPPEFRRAAAEAIQRFAERVYPKKITAESRDLQKTASPESLARWESLAGTLPSPARGKGERLGLRAGDEGLPSPARGKGEGRGLRAGDEGLPSPARGKGEGRGLRAGDEGLPSPACGRGAGGEGSQHDLDLPGLRAALLDFIADFANWDNSTVPAYLETARALTQAAHEALGGAPGTRPLVVDPFAGGGSIPLEALRVGADAFASDLNPVAVLLNKVVLEYIPKYGKRLADEVRKWGQWVKEQAEKELAEFYPKDPDGATPIAYLWARTIKCEGPGCGAEVPLMRSLWLAKKANRSVALRIIPNPRAKRVDFEIIERAKPGDVGKGTVARGSATCPCCGFTTPVKSVRAQFKARKGGAADARMFAVVTARPDTTGRYYRLPTERDLKPATRAAAEIDKRRSAHTGRLSLVPEELTPRGGGSGAGRAFSQRHYGMEQFCDLFTPRQLLALTTLARLVREAGEQLANHHDSGLAEAVQACLAVAVDRQADATSSLCRWHVTGEKHAATFGRQAIPMVWDLSEVNVLSEMTGGFPGALEWVWKVCDLNSSATPSHGHVQRASAAAHPLPDDAATGFVSDPPYYDAVPYSDLSDFFYVWLKRTLPKSLLAGFADELTPKGDECIVDEVKGKDKAYFEKTMAQAMAEGQRILQPSGVGVVVFAHKSTAGWEAQLQAMVDAGWRMTGSWPIDTEMGTRLRAMDSAALASSVHLVCRPREKSDGSVGTGDVGDWREVLAELPKRIHEWMPRLSEEGIVGADAIFACLGPALEIFSRYSRVEKASGEAVTLKEYLEHVWAAVAREALAMIFSGTDATGFEEDARLTTMWLWTLSTGNGKKVTAEDAEGAEEEEGDEGGDSPRSSASSAVKSRYALEYDAARKIAQGLGAHLETLTGVVEVKGETARLLSVAERTKALLGKDQAGPPVGRKKKARQLKLAFEDELEEEVRRQKAEGAKGEWAPRVGTTTLDRVHQSMILFAAGRSEAMRRFLVEEGVGRDGRFWTLAQALSALYPPGSDEKRWVDGVLARKKGLGL